jgi:hypothetical protein
MKRTGILLIALALAFPAGARDIPLPGDDPGTTGSGKDKGILSSKAFNLSGYVENTLNVEYIKGDREALLNQTRAKLLLSGEPNRHLDYGIGVVGNLYVGQTTADMTNYLPRDTVLASNVENIFAYNFSNEIYIQEAFGTLYAGWFRLRIGRHRFYTGTGYAFNPIDIFNRKNPLDPTYEIDGIDALLVSFELPKEWRIQGLVRFGENFSTTDYLARVSTRFGSWDLAVQYTHATKSRYDWDSINQPTVPGDILAGTIPISAFEYSFVWDFVAAEFSGELFGVHIYGEGGYAFVRPEKGRGNLSRADRDHERILVGLDYTFRFQLYIMAEYMRIGRAAPSAGDITLNDRIAWFSGETLTMVTDTIYAGLSYPVHDLVDLSLYSLVGINDGSAWLVPWLEVNLFPGLKLSVMGSVPLGKEKSQVGRMGPGGFIRLKYYF